MSKVFNYLKKQGAVRLQLQDEVLMKDTSLDYIDEKMVDLIVYLQSEKRESTLSWLTTGKECKWTRSFGTATA